MIRVKLNSIAFNILPFFFIFIFVEYEMPKLKIIMCFLFCRFMVVLICLIFSVLSTIKEYESFANETLYWMVRETIINGFVFLCFDL